MWFKYTAVNTLRSVVFALAYVLDEGIYRHNGVKWVSGTSMTGLCVSAAERRAQDSVDLGQLDLRHVWHASLLSVWMATEHNMAQGAWDQHTHRHMTVREQQRS